MPEILPNWHPAAVHFPMALTVTAALLLLASQLRPTNPQCTACARLLLVLAALSALLTAGLGWYAYATVDHDAAGHRVMTQHRNWALACTGGLLLLALWDVRRQRAGQLAHVALLPALLLVAGGLVMTGWLGGEMVYRHGIGVLPTAFAAPESVTPALPASPVPEAPPAIQPAAPALMPGEHIHQDGRRHHH